MKNTLAILEAQERLSRYRTSHILHLILTLITLGIWIPIWVLTDISNSIERTKAMRRLAKLSEE